MGENSLGKKGVVGMLAFVPLFSGNVICWKEVDDTALLRKEEESMLILSTGSLASARI